MSLFDWKDFAKPAKKNATLADIRCNSCWNKFDYSLAYVINDKLYCPLCTVFEGVILATKMNELFDKIGKWFIRTVLVVLVIGVIYFVR